MLRLATFNVENMFSRPKVMSGTWAEGKKVLDDVTKLTGLLAKPVYSAADKNAIRQIMLKYEFGNRQKKDRPFDIRENKGKLFVVPKGTKDVRIEAKGRDSWAGWVELTKQDIDFDATVNTGRVIDAIKPDVICTVEVEDRLTLDRFDQLVLSKFAGAPFSFNMLVDGNDARGIDVGLYCRKEIRSIRSHVQDGGKDRIFSRDCPEFEIPFANGKTLWVLGNHFKSQGFGAPKSNDAKRLRQATRVAEIYAECRKRSDFVAVAGDLNVPPGHASIKPLRDTDLKDVMSHPAYQGPAWTFAPKKEKLDYILLSPALWQKIKAVGLETRGVFAPRTVQAFPEVTSRTNAASDHAALWVDLDL